MPDAPLVEDVCGVVRLVAQLRWSVFTMVRPGLSLPTCPGPRPVAADARGVTIRLVFADVGHQSVLDDCRLHRNSGNRHPTLGVVDNQVSQQIGYGRHGIDRCGRPVQCAWMLSASSVGENDLATQSAAPSVRELSTVTTQVASTTLVSVTVVEARQSVEVCPAGMRHAAFSGSARQ